MSSTININKGLDIRLLGSPERKKTVLTPSSIISLSPLDFHGLNPKMIVKEGDAVKIGDPLFFDKTNESILFVSTASGNVKAVVRGEKRKILQILIEAGSSQEFKVGEPVDSSKLSSEEIKTKMLASGLWPFIKQRPIDVIADPNQEPKSIFISTFDSSPLAPDYSYILDGKSEDLQAGIDVLCKLTKGDVHLNVDAKNENTLFSNLKGVKLNKFSGKHPAGNVGTQIHHINPINKGEFIWTVNIQDLAIIGNYFNTGKFNATRTIALTGSEVIAPQYFDVLIGTNLDSILNKKINNDNVRIISGNVLTGDRKEKKDYLGFYHNQITVIPEGDNYKFFLTKGWLGLGFDKFSNSRLFPTFLAPKTKNFVLDTNTNGEERAFVVTGELERVFPFDILPMQLIKAAITNDIDGMENLGIYEVAPEDFALCEYVCTTKINIQDKIRTGLDLIAQECL